MAVSRRSLLKAGSVLLGACGFNLVLNSTSGAQTRTGNFYHVVYFWLKNPSNGSDRSKFLKSLNSFLDEVDVIRNRHVGTPADTNREVIDSTYTFSLILSFDNSKDQDYYQDHPAHKRFIAESEELWEKVTVYDSIALP